MNKSKTKPKPYKLPDYIVRMLSEHKDLNERIVKANQAMTIENMFSFDSWCRLDHQIDAMCKYRYALMDRISEAIHNEYYKYHDKSGLSAKKFSEWVEEVLK
ncbi:MAG: hypothetical protein IJY80_00545 [Opitutales bacterium]|nr:hypothetical protein [Opitutales bacterium]